MEKGKTIQIEKNKVELTENQYKVIKDKYLQNSPSIEEWLYGVATNIALGEIIYIQNIKEEEIFKGVNYVKEITQPVKGNVSVVHLLHKGIKGYDERNKNFKKFMSNLYDLAANNPKCVRQVQETAQKFYDLMANFEFLPNSPTLMNAGRDLQQLSACYVLGIEDSIEGWLNAVTAAGIIQKTGGGTGFSVSRVRPKGAQVKSTKGVASGPLSPLKMIDSMTYEIRQGSMRRGANMGILSVHHPDIMDFINVKKTPGVLENFNISVAIDESFMDAVKNNTEYELIDPHTNKVTSKMRARYVWEEMIKGAWETGDPGFVVIDRINNTDSNPTPALGQIESTNPCVTGDSLVLTEFGPMRMDGLVKNYPNGGIKIATDNRVPIKIMNYNGTISFLENIQEGITFYEISKAFESGIKNVYLLKTKSGFEIKVTEDHKIFTNEGFIPLRELDIKKHLIYAHSDNGALKETIESIDFIGKKTVYDLTEPITHSFICNNLIVANCGEQPLLPNEPCNLGSINLSKFIKNDRSDFDWQKLKQCVWDCTHFLDNVITVNNYPLEDIEDISKKNRRIGLGVMGWAEALVLLGIPYNDERAFRKAEETMKLINDECLKASIELGKERGIFFNFKDSIYDKDGDYFRGEDVKPRNCARTTIAPTGTIGIAAGLQGAGIEPFFAIAYTRYNAKALDYLKEGKTPPAEHTFWEINPIFKEVAEKNNYFGISEDELWKKIEKNHKSVKGIKEIPEKIQNLFLTSHDLEPKDHIMIQAAFQKHTNNAVSKTINLRNEATIADVEECYMLSYKLGCKGITIYRDGSKQFQVLNLSDKKTEKKEEPAVIKPLVRKKSTIEMSTYYEIETGYGPLHVHINYDEEGPTRVFCNLAPIGTEVSGLTTALGILISKYLEYGGDPVKLLKHLNSIKGDKPFGFGNKRIDSIAHGIAQAIKDHLIKTGKMATKIAPLKDENKQLKLDVDGFEIKVSIYCPQCYSANVEMQSGCSEPTCFDCGYSKCS